MRAIFHRGNMDGERISDLAVCHLLFWKRNKGMCDNLCDLSFEND